MKKKKLQMIGNAHIDPVWLWQWQEGVQEVKSTFRSALDLMEEYEAFLLTASSAAFYEWVKKSDPGIFEEIRARIQLPRWSREIEADFAPCEIKTFRVPTDENLPVIETNLLEWEEQEG